MNDNWAKKLEGYNLLAIYDVMLDISQELNIAVDDFVVIPLLPPVIKFRQLFPGDSSEMRDRYYNTRLKAIKYLHKQGVIKEYDLIEGVDSWENEIKVISNKDSFEKHIKQIKEELESRKKEKPSVGKDSLQQRPVVFISYANVELALADFIKQILMKRVGESIDVFVASRDIPPGDDWQRTMMENKLKNASAIITICSLASKQSGWAWWETGSVWAKGNSVYPLYTNISMNEFGPPLSLVAQGKCYFIKEDLKETLSALFKQLGLKADFALNLEEEGQLEKIKKEYSGAHTSASVEIKYKARKTTGTFHEYSLGLIVENKSTKAFKEIVCELFFPSLYIRDKIWNLPHVHSITPKDHYGYLCLIFDFNGLKEYANQKYRKYLLPGQKLMIFGDGEEAITPLTYEVDDVRYEKIKDYKVWWKVYIDGGAPIEGSTRFEELQQF